MKDCHCLPWDMVRNDTHYDYELCDNYGNYCFLQKMEQASEDGVIERDCFCLDDCENVKYSQFATLKPHKMVDCNVNSWNSSSFAPISLMYQKSLILPKLHFPTENISNWYQTEDLILNDYWKKMCEKIVTEDKSELIIRMEGPTFMTLKRSLRVTAADKLGSIGGTLGLFTGFSLLAIMEVIHWICKIINSLVLSNK